MRMKQIHVAKHAPEAHLVKGFLESSVWIEDERQYDRAQALLVAFLNGDIAREMRSRNWRCPQCGEQQEGQFTACWKCGAPRPA
ncbi:MAG: hypothetical protein HYV99_07225 [Betaproteobacteria bacterium]|nr:hypothetical protein [Betaproteobacteria bacterium]